MPGLVQGKAKRELETRAQRAARRGRAEGARPAPAGRALRRRAAARRARAGAVPRAAAPPGRRADGQPRLGDERADPRALLRDQQAAGHDHRRRHAQPGPRRASMPRVVTLQDGRVEKDERRAASRSPWPRDGAGTPRRIATSLAHQRTMTVRRRHVHLALVDRELRPAARPTRAPSAPSTCTRGTICSGAQRAHDLGRAREAHVDLGRLRLGVRVARARRPGPS